MGTRILTPEDRPIVPAYVALFNKVLDEIGQFYNTATLQDARNHYTAAYVSSHLTPDQERRFIGHFSRERLNGILIESFDKEENRTGINWVMAEEKGKGIGTSLIQDCIGRAKEEGKSHIALAVSQTNNSARKLYERLGFISGGKYLNKHELPMELMGYLFD
jgi:GNAT superfamily N-acetyltransferase